MLHTLAVASLDDEVAEGVTMLTVNEFSLPRRLQNLSAVTRAELVFGKDQSNLSMGRTNLASRHLKLHFLAVHL